MIYVLWKEQENDGGVYGVGVSFDDIFAYMVDGFTLEGIVATEAELRELVLDVIERLGYSREDGETTVFEISWEEDV